MKLLYNKAKVEKQKLKKYILNVVGTELSNINQPCYKARLRRHQSNIEMLCGITDQDLYDLTKRLYKGTPKEKWQLINDIYTNLLVFCVYYFLRQNDLVGANAAVDFIGIRFYTNLLEKNFRYCDPHAFHIALERLKSHHLFLAKGSISGGIYYLCRQEMLKYKQGILKGDTNTIVKFILELRHRIAQSLRSLQNQYYKVKEQGAGLGSRPENEEGYSPYNDIISLTPDSKIISDIVEKMIIPSEIDKNAFRLAQRFSALNTDTCKFIVTGLCNSKYSSDLSQAIYYLLTDFDDLKKLCSNQYYSYIKKLFLVRDMRSNPGQYKLIVQKITKDIVNNEKNIKRGKSRQYNSSMYKFLFFYIAFFVRNYFCS